MGSHHTPKHYLRRFEDPERPEFIWLHVKGDRAAKSVPIAAAAQSPGFYSPAVEKSLNVEVEVPGNRAIRKLVEGIGLNRTERIDLARYVGVMMTRGPRRRRKSLVAAPSMMSKLAGELREELGARYAAGEVSDEFLAAASRELTVIESGERIPESILEAIAEPRLGPRVAAILMSMPWRVARATNGRFVTSDNPVHFFEWLGLGQETSEFLLPLSATVALHGCWQGEPESLEFVDADWGLVREFNRRSFTGAERVRFSSAPERWLLDRRDKVGGMLNRIQWS